MAGNRFDGKVAIVSAGGGGIGFAVSVALAKQGAAVVIADRSKENAESTAAKIKSFGGRSLAVTMDIGRADDLKPAVSATLAAFGRLDILINCAGTMGIRKSFLDTTPADWEEVVRTNLMGTVLLTQLAIRQMLAQGDGGAVVNILAIQASMPLASYSPYAATKGALTTFTRSLAIEFADKGIRVNGIAVGPIYTDAARKALGTAEPEPTREMDEAAATLVGRMGRPEDVAHVALFLASEDAAYIAGAIIPADGGRTISRKPDPYMKVEAARVSSGI